MQDTKRFPQNARGRRLHLDVAGRVKLAPDISWWEHQRCCFVGDVKYKPINVPGIKYPDLYQLLAYTVATGLPSGLLIYAAGETEPRTHEIVMLGERLEVVALDLDGSPDSILAQIETVAIRVRRQRPERLTSSSSPDTPSTGSIRLATAQG